MINKLTDKYIDYLKEMRNIDNIELKIKTYNNIIPLNLLPEYKLLIDNILLLFYLYNEHQNIDNIRYLIYNKINKLNIYDKNDKYLLIMKKLIKYRELDSIYFKKDIIKFITNKNMFYLNEIKNKNIYSILNINDINMYIKNIIFIITRYILHILPNSIK